MNAEELKKGIFAVGALDPDRKLFDELIPLPDGTSYNAYLIRGSSKTALIDTVDPEKAAEMLAKLEELAVARLDYIIANHAEQDHSGSISVVLERYPEAQVVTNSKCSGFLQDLLHIDPAKFNIVEDGDTLSLGDKTLKFISTPWVHWPETMSTYLQEDQVLFPCDLFGSHVAQSEVFVTNAEHTLTAAKRYYAEIMMPFAGLVRKNLDRLAELQIDMIAPSHGPVYQNPDFILKAYSEWTDDRVSDTAVLSYVSMHGSTRVMVEHLKTKLEEQSVRVFTHDLVSGDPGELAIELVDAATIILASPTVLTGAHPAAVSAAYLVNILKPKARYLGVIGSFGWGGKMVEQLSGLLDHFRGEVLDPVLIKGLPKPDDLKVLDDLADDIVLKHKSLGIHI